MPLDMDSRHRYKSLDMAKDGYNNGTTRWVAGGLFGIIVVVLAPLLHEVIQGAKVNAAQDATISSINETNSRIEKKVDRILERLSQRVDASHDGTQ